MAQRSLTPFLSRLSSPARGGVPGDPLGGMRDYVDRLFEDFSRGIGLPAAGGEAGFLSPEVNVAETATGLEVTADLPGLDPSDIQIDVSDGVLTVRAERKAEREEKDEARKYHLVERSVGTYLRRFALPFQPDEDRIEARFEKGVLTIVLPRAAEAEKRQRKIEIKSA